MMRTKRYTPQRMNKASKTKRSLNQQKKEEITEKVESIRANFETALDFSNSQISKFINSQE